MLSYETPRELSYESFVETFGKEPTDVVFSDLKNQGKKLGFFAGPNEMASSILKIRGSKYSSTTQQDYTSNNATDQNHSVVEVSVPVHKETRTERMSKKLRKLSLKKKDAGKSGENKKSNPLHRSKSVSFLGKSSAPHNWFANFNASIHNRGGRKSRASDDSVVTPPMSKMTSAAAHRAYLSVKHQKTQEWTRYWCILKDSCLYCYSSRDVEFADDVIALGGYVVTSTVGSNMYFSRPGKEMYECRGDDEKAQDEWLNALTQNVVAVKRNFTKLQRSTSAALTSPKKKKLPPVYERSVSDFSLDVTRLKAKLLEEVLAEQQEIIREQRKLERLFVSKSQPFPTASQRPIKLGFILPAEQPEDHGYCSSFDGSVSGSSSECGDSRNNSPTSRSYRSMSTVSVASSLSLCSIPEEGRKLSDVCPQVIAEIEEFRAFSQKILKKDQSS